MRYGFILDHRLEFRIVKMCQVLEVSRSGYYRWQKRSSSRRERSNRALLAEIRSIHEHSRGIYGSPRVTAELRASGWVCGENRVARLMRQNEIVSRRKRKYRKTTDSRHSYPVSPNHLSREFTVSRPNAAWVSDITYIWTSEGWLYLAGIVDLYSRMVIGWSMSRHLNSQLTLAALHQALNRRDVRPGLIHHSDRGGEYAAGVYQAKMSACGMIGSMSRKGDCWDNAVMESFFATLKTELVYQQQFVTRQEAKLKIFEYIEVFYNRQRRHSTLEYKTPAEFEMMLY